ncbi:hypothetical protein EV126DRAFT_412082 [Verticillium dahliae]|nr:hypothetical protein EV126DRAFT_412082 [Verticillium dahliae]
MILLPSASLFYSATAHDAMRCDAMKKIKPKATNKSQSPSSARPCFGAPALVLFRRSPVSPDLSDALVDPPRVTLAKALIARRVATRHPVDGRVGNTLARVVVHAGIAVRHVGQALRGRGLFGDCVCPEQPWEMSVYDVWRRKPGVGGAEEVVFSCLCGDEGMQ